MVTSFQFQMQCQPVKHTVSDRQSAERNTLTGVWLVYKARLFSSCNDGRGREAKDGNGGQRMAVL